MKKLSIWALLVCAAFAARPASAVPITVTKELLLLVDSSGSINQTEYNLQKAGYVAAFNDIDVRNKILSMPNGLAIAYAEWAGVGTYNERVGWTLINSPASYDAFVASLNALTKQTPSNQNTAPGAAILAGIISINNNNYAAPDFEKIIDISGDGASNDDASGEAGNDRTAARALLVLAAAKKAHDDNKITINGLPILTDEAATLEAFYTNNITAPGGGKIFVAADFTSFDKAIKDKINFEVDPQIPEPTTISMMGLGLLGLGFAARRRIKK